MKVYKKENLDIEAFKKIATSISYQLKVGDIVCLHGNLGAGKTQFAKSLISNITNFKEENVQSPTFNIVQTYKLKNDEGEIWHFDLYRLKDPEELIEIGLEEALDRAISIIEWPEIASEYLPEDKIDVIIEFSKEKNKRNIEIKSSKWLKL